MNTLHIQHVSKTYPKGVKALNDVSLTISNGIFGLLGPNGAGKSTLMKTIVGLQKPTEGKLYFNDNDIVANPIAVQKHLGFLPQYFGVYPKVSAYGLLDHIAKLKGISNKNQRKDQIINLLDKVNLLEAKNKEVHTFSGGLRQRFGVAQALLGEPKIIIVDEPTAGLDPEERNRFNFLLSDIGENVIIILSTHLVEDVRNLCSRMVILKEGTIVSQGSPKQLIEQLNDKLWSKTINKGEMAELETRHHVISKQLIEKVMHITVYADECPQGFQSVTPTLEHVYFRQLNGY